MLRKTLVSLAVTGALYAVNGYALELGELTTQSSIDEPFRGQIELSDVGKLTPQDILVRLGSENEFRQAGFAPSAVLNDLSFDVSQAKDGKGLVIDVVSKQVIKVKELHFVLAARWPSGQVVREYDTPINQSALVDKTQKEVVQSPKVTSAKPKNTKSSNSSAGSTSTSAFRQATIEANKLSDKGNAFTQEGNTLWGIAEKAAPSNKLNIYQTMMAIQALNKDAFYSNNINLLKKNVVLRIPTEKQIALFNRSMSKEEFDRQTRLWQAIKASSSKNAPVAREQLNTQAKGKGASTQPMSGTDRLSLASGQSVLPEKNASSNEGKGNQTADVESKLSATEEMLDKEKREKGDLTEKLGDLNKQLDTLQKLISLKDTQMAELQKQLASAQQSMQEQKNTVDQLLEADQLRREKEKADADSWMNKIFGNPIIVSIGAVVLLMLGFLIGLLMRRLGKKKPEKKTDEEYDLAPSTALGASAVGASAAIAAAQMDETKEEDLAEEDPFAFDFDADETKGDFDEFDGLEEPEEEAKEEDFELPDDGAFSDDTAEQSEALFEDDEEDPFASLDAEMDDLTDIDDDESEDDFALPEEMDSFDDELEKVPDDEDIPTIEPESEPEPVADKQEDDEALSEEESFVSSLLEDNDLEEPKAEDEPDQEDRDESAVFDQEPNESLASSIEETLAEAQQDDDIDVPSFGEAEAAEGEEVDDDEEEFDFFDASGDEAATKLDLARAYMDMGDDEGARVILEDVVSNGNEQQVAEAKSMIERMFPSD